MNQFLIIVSLLLGFDQAFIVKKPKEFVTPLLDHQFLTTVFKTSDSNKDSTHGLVFSTEPLVNVSRFWSI